MLNRGGSGTSKSIPLRLWYLGSAYVFGKYLFFSFFIFTQLDIIAQSWGQLPIFFLRSYLKSKIRRKIPLIPFATYSQHPVKDKMGNSKETFYKMILVT